MKKKVKTEPVLVKGLIVIHAPEAKIEDGKSYMVFDESQNDIGLNFKAMGGVLVEQNTLEIIDSSQAKKYNAIYQKDIIPVISTEEEVRSILNWINNHDGMGEEDKEEYDEFAKDKHFVSLHVSSIHTIIYQILCYVSISDDGAAHANNKAFKYNIINGVISQGDVERDFDDAELTEQEFSQCAGSQPEPNTSPNPTA